MGFVHQHRRENQNEKAESRGIRGPAGPWAASTANATIVTVFNNWTDGLTNFNSKIAGAGGTATHDNWASLSFSNGDTELDRTGYKLTRTDGSALSDQGIYYAYGSSPTANTTGSTIDIDPYGNGTDNGHGDNNGLAPRAAASRWATGPRAAKSRTFTFPSATTPHPCRLITDRR